MRKLTFEELTEIRFSEESIKDADRFPVIVVLHDIRSAYNVGSIFRSADAFRVEQLVLTGYTPTPPNKEIQKTALDAEKTVPWFQAQSLKEFITESRSSGRRIFAIEVAQSSRNVTQLRKSDFPAVFILGNELTGISTDVMSLCDGAIEIAMHGVKHSLNVAVAAGIVMHQAASVLSNSTS